MMTDCDFVLINPLFVSLHGFVGSFCLSLFMALLVVFKKRPVRPAP